MSRLGSSVRAFRQFRHFCESVASPRGIVRNNPQWKSLPLTNEFGIDGGRCMRQRATAGFAMSRSFFSGTSPKTSPVLDKLTDQNSSLPPPPDLHPDAPKDLSIVPNELVDLVSTTANYLREAATTSIAWIQETSEPILHILRERFDLQELSSQTVTQLIYTSTAAALAWLVMPRVFRMIHRYFGDGSSILLWRSEKIPYELSVWAALEDPARILLTVVVFTQLGSLIAPTTISSAYLEQIWKGTAVIALIWFLHRWKSNVVSRVLENKSLGTPDREWVLTLNKISSVGLFMLGGMAVAETCGIAAQSILTVGGIGGVATAFAARDILGNLLSGLALQFMRPFSIGDIIKAGPIEGQVLDIGLTSTQLLDNDKFPVAVPNSYFSNQMIVNKSRASWHAFSFKVPIHVKDFEKIPQITDNVKKMLKSHAGIVTQHGAPHCYVSRVAGSALEVTVLCNMVAAMGKDELLLTQQDLILQVLKIATNAGATVGAAEI